MNKCDGIEPDKQLMTQFKESIEDRLKSKRWENKNALDKIKITQMDKSLGEQKTALDQLVGEIDKKDKELSKNQGELSALTDLVKKQGEANEEQKVQMQQLQTTIAQ